MSLAIDWNISFCSSFNWGSIHRFIRIRHIKTQASVIISSFSGGVEVQILTSYKLRKLEKSMHCKSLNDSACAANILDWTAGSRTKRKCSYVKPPQPDGKPATTTWGKAQCYCDVKSSIPTLDPPVCRGGWNPSPPAALGGQWFTRSNLKCEQPQAAAVGYVPGLFPGKEQRLPDVLSLELYQSFLQSDGAKAGFITHRSTGVSLLVFRFALAWEQMANHSSCCPPLPPLLMY